MKLQSAILLTMATTLSCIAPVGGGGQAAPSDRSPTVFRDVSVLTMAGDPVLPDHSVVVEDGEITWVGPSDQLRSPAGARTIEGRGRFLLPGLADMHVHIGRSDIPLLFVNGVTTVREMNGSDGHLALRDSIAAGRVVGPRMIVTSPLLAGVEQRWRHELIADPDAAIRAAREAGDGGYEALKVYDGLSAATYAALVEASRSLDLPLVGHVPSDVGLDAVLEAGQRSIEHTEQIMYATVGHDPDPSRIPAIASTIARSDTWVVPTLASQRIISERRTSAYNARFDAPEMRFVDPGYLGWWRSLAAPEGAEDPPADDPARRRAEAFYGFQRDLAIALHEAGVPLLAGTDTPNPMLVPGYSLHHELAAMLDAGIPALDVLLAATANAARFLGEDGEWGVVAVGAAADLVLVDENPLVRIGTLRNPAGVMVRGHWMDRGDLEAVLP